MSVSQNEPIDEVNGDRNAGEEPGLPWEFVVIGRLIAVKEGKRSGSDQQGRGEHSQAMKRDDHADEDKDDQKQWNGLGFHGRVSSRRA
jgi:hypothetical protein